VSPERRQPGAVGRREVPDTWQQHLIWLTTGTDDHVEVFTVPAAGAGIRPTTLFLHGWGLSPRSYADCIDALAGRGAEVVAPTLPGFGESSALRRGTAVVTGVESRIAEALRQMGLTGPFPVVAHSFGSGVATHLALRHPELVASLTLVTPVGGAGSAVTSWAELVTGVRRELRRGSAARAVDVVPNLLRNPFAVARTAVAAKHMDLVEPLHRVADLAIPIRLVLAERDGLVPPGRLRAFETLPGFEVTVVDGNHGWLLHEPEEFARVALP
jgi:pimeloyl-ACP methyl ester carboxylesterase